jgi:CRISPR/Cas system CSM-associated protein Csm3 (group 7 of RAMP superfamily)
MRGVLRSRAEKILRTLAASQMEQDLYNSACEKKASREELFNSRCPACDPQAHETDSPLASCDTLMTAYEKNNNNRKIVGMPKDNQICLACALFGSPRNGSRLFVEDASFQQITPAVAAQYKLQDFLAIDRFTGGGKKSAKFDALALWRPTFRASICLENAARWELGLLALLFKDLEDGLLSVGFGAAKGYGRVTASDWNVQLHWITEAGCAELLGDGLRNIQTRPSGLFQRYEINTGCFRTSEVWKGLAANWLRALLERLRDFRRAEGIGYQQDSYFGKLQERLYPLEVRIDA